MLIEQSMLDFLPEHFAHIVQSNNRFFLFFVFFLYLITIYKPRIIDTFSLVRSSARNRQHWFIYSHRKTRDIGCLKSNRKYILSTYLDRIRSPNMPNLEQIFVIWHNDATQRNNLSQRNTLFDAKGDWFNSQQANGTKLNK